MGSLPLNDTSGPCMFTYTYLLLERALLCLLSLLSCAVEDSGSSSDGASVRFVEPA